MKERKKEREMAKVSGCVIGGPIKAKVSASNLLLQFQANNFHFQANNFP
jgi:hypothetical protein